MITMFKPATVPSDPPSLLEVPVIFGGKVVSIE
jgi:hypothetical protein